jgi:hypothetical protein
MIELTSVNLVTVLIVLAIIVCLLFIFRGRL